jgi:hypothetical protein
MVSKESRVTTNDKNTDQDPLEAPVRTPDTPTEPKPAPVQDPPAEPGRPPLVVLRAVSNGSPQRETSYD